MFHYFSPKEKQDNMLRKLKAGGHDISNLQHDAIDESKSRKLK